MSLLLSDIRRPGNGSNCQSGDSGCRCYLDRNTIVKIASDKCAISRLRDQIRWYNCMPPTIQKAFPRILEVIDDLKTLEVRYRYIEMASIASSVLKGRFYVHRCVESCS